MPSIWLCHQVAESAPTPGWLLPAEAETVARLGSPRRREFLSSRWLIRQALALASDERPEACAPVTGRPVQSARPPGWRLSLSHSHGLCACAVGDSDALGIDLEPRGRHPQWQRVVRRWFSEAEQTWLLARDNPEDFLVAWTLKEAWLKATGRGIAGNLQTLEIGPGFILTGDTALAGWHAACFDCEGYLVTLVYRRRDGTDHPSGWPPIQLLEPPPEDLALSQAERLPTLWEPFMQRSITPRPAAWTSDVRPGQPVVCESETKERL